MPKTKTSARKTAPKPIVVSEPNDTVGVDAYMKKFRHPLKAEMEAVRNTIMRASEKMSERIKWNAPSFFYLKDMGAINWSAQNCVQLVIVFHDGAMLPRRYGILEGDYKDRRLAKFYSMSDVKAKTPALKRVVEDWVKLVEKSA